VVVFIHVQLTKIKYIFFSEWEWFSRQYNDSQPVVYLWEQDFHKTCFN